MKKEFKFSLIDGCVSVTKRNEIPARFTSVGGDTYAVGTIIDLCEVVTMKPISAGGNNWQGVGSIINGSHVVIGANTLMGTYFKADAESDTQTRETIDNGINTISIKDMLDKTVKVVGHEDVKIFTFLTDAEKEAGKVRSVINKRMPIFEIVNEDGSPLVKEVKETPAQKRARLAAETK